MFQTHMSGLRQMLELRGDISAHRDTNPNIANIVCIFLAVVDESLPVADLSSELKQPAWYFDAFIFLNVNYFIDFEPCNIDPAFASLMQKNSPPSYALPDWRRLHLSSRISNYPHVSLLDLATAA
jgi:hypothetical protein